MLVIERRASFSLSRQRLIRLVHLTTLTQRLPSVASKLQHGGNKNPRPKGSQKHKRSVKHHPPGCIDSRDTTRGRCAQGLRALIGHAAAPTAKQRDELAPSHYSLTSSAVASSVGGKSSPSSLAVWWLITSSNLVDCMTGKSMGLAPLRMRPT